MRLALCFSSLQPLKPGSIYSSVALEEGASHHVSRIHPPHISSVFVFQRLPQRRFSLRQLRRLFAAPAPVAYVYVATSKGINLYNAASNGKLTLVSGSPFKTTGLMIGSNQKFFITLGTYWVRSYPVKANGAIGAQVSQINTQNYSGSDCGTTNGAVLDHSGQDVYVLLNVPPDRQQCM